MLVVDLVDVGRPAEPGVGTGGPAVRVGRQGRQGQQRQRRQQARHRGRTGRERSDQVLEGKSPRILKALLFFASRYEMWPE